METFNFKKNIDKAGAITTEYENIVYSISSAEKISLLPGERRKVNTFVEVEIPENFLGLILPRKEIYLRYGLYVLSDIILPKQKKELQIYITNVNIPKHPMNLTDYERFAGDKFKADIHIGDKIANIIFIKSLSLPLKEII